MTQPAANPLEAQRLNGDLGFLFLLLSTATLFDGFDGAMLTIAAPDARATLGTPIAIALLIDRLGIAWSVGVVAFGPILGALLVLRYAPETKGLTLEEVQAMLARNAGGRQPAPRAA